MLTRTVNCEAVVVALHLGGLLCVGAFRDEWEENNFKVLVNFSLVPSQIERK